MMVCHSIIKCPVIYCVLFFAIVAMRPTLAETADSIDSSTISNTHEQKRRKISLSPESLKWMDEKQKKWSGDVVDIGAYIDGFMGDIDTLKDTNKSYVRVYFDFDGSKNDSIGIKPKIRFSLDLPIAKKKLRLVVESDPDESIQERNLAQLPSTVQSESEGLYASFRYLFDSEKWQRLSFDWGVKARLPPDPFARSRAVRRWELSDYWDMHYSQEVFWFESKGLGSYTQFDFDRYFDSNDDFFLRVTNVLDWNERREQFDLLEQLSLYQDVSDKRAVQYAVGFTGLNRESHSVITNFFTRATYRRRLYKDWLFYELTPGVEFPRDEDFKANPFISLRLEILFSEDASRKLTTKLY